MQRPGDHTLFRQLWPSCGAWEAESQVPESGRFPPYLDCHIGISIQGTHDAERCMGASHGHHLGTLCYKIVHSICLASKQFKSSTLLQNLLPFSPFQNRMKGFFGHYLCLMIETGGTTVPNAIAIRQPENPAAMHPNVIDAQINLCWCTVGRCCHSFTHPSASYNDLEAPLRVLFYAVEPMHNFS